MKSITLTIALFTLIFSNLAFSFTPPLDKCKYRQGVVTPSNALFAKMGSDTATKMYASGNEVGMFCRLKLDRDTSCYLGYNEMDEELLTPFDMDVAALKEGSGTLFKMNKGKGAKSYLQVNRMEGRGKFYTVNIPNPNAICFTRFKGGDLGSAKNMTGNSQQQAPKTGKLNIEVSTKRHPNGTTSLHIQAIDDKVTVLGAVLNRGNCKMWKFNARALSEGVNLNYGKSYKISTHCKSNELREFEVTTNTGTYVFSI